MTAPADWPILELPAFRGIAAEIIDALDQHTEADPAAMLLTLMTMFGNAVGPGPHARVGADNHGARLSIAIVGETSRARKGSGFSMIASVMAVADPDWARDRILSGFGSGERVIDEVADADDDQPQKDRRVLIREAELARFHTIANRENSILSMIARESWDGGRLSVRTRGGTTTATGSHISTVGDITAEELRRTLTATEMSNGGANRTLFALARRSKKLPSGGNLDDEDVAYLGGKLKALLLTARTRSRMHRTSAAEAIWDPIYRAVDDSVDGLFGSIVARAEPQMLRLSLIFALLDGRKEIDVEHVRAAVCVWSYCEASARWIFAKETTGDPIADRIYSALREAGDDGLDLTQIAALFGRHETAKRLEIAREKLIADGLATSVRQSTSGRSATRLFVAKEANDAKEVGETFADRVRCHLISLPSLSSQSENGQGRPNEATLRVAAAGASE